MRKFLLVLAALSSAVCAFAQDWQTVTIDSAVSVQLPKGYEKKTLNGQDSYIGRTVYGTILIFKTDDNPRVFPDIEKDKHLLNYYKDYIQKVSRSVKGAMISDQRDTLIGELKVKDFKLALDSGTGKQFRNFRIFHANAATYVFEYLYQDLQSEYAAPEIQKLFSSVKVSEDLKREDQYISTDNPKPGADSRRNTLTIGIIVGVVVLVLAVILIARRRR